MDLDIFVAKQAVNGLLSPLNLWLVISMVGIVLCIVWPRRSGGVIVLLGGIVWLAVGALPVTGLAILRFFENHAGKIPDPGDLGKRGIRCVVVLGNVDEGTKLWKQINGATLLLSSGSYTSAMVERARHLGVPDSAILVEDRGRDTLEQAENIRHIVGGGRFVVCTWALHMPRTLLAFKRQGVDPVPAPTDFLSRHKPTPQWFWPSKAGLNLTRLALHEFLGTIWLWTK